MKTHSPLPLDQTEQAIADIQAGLALRKEVLEPTDRRVAEALVNVEWLSKDNTILFHLSVHSHFNLGLAYSLSKQFDQSVQVDIGDKIVASVY